MSNHQVQSSGVLSDDKSFLVPNTMNFENKVSSSSQYKFYSITSQASGSTVTLGAAVVSAIFNIPANVVFNLSRSKLRFSMLFASPGNVSIKAFCHTPPINAISLKTANSAVLVDLQSVQAYWPLTRCAYPKDKYLKHGPIRGAATVANARATNTICKFHNPSSALVSTTIAANVNTGVKLDSTGAILQPTGSLDFQTQQMLLSGTSNTTLAMQCEISMDQFVHTFLACPKNFAANEQLTLQVDFAISSNCAFQSTSPTDIAGVAAYTAGTAITIGDLAFDLAVEMNPFNAQTIRDEINSSGLSLTIPKVTVRNNSTAAAGQTTISQIINQGIGSNLLRVYTGEKFSNESANTLHNFNNSNGAKVTFYRYNVDGKAVQDSPMDVVQMVDWMFNSERLEDSAQICPGEFYIQTPSSFLEYGNCPKLTDSSTQDFNIVSGLNIIGANLTIDKVMTTAANNLLTFWVLVGQVPLISTKDGVVLPSVNGIKAIQQVPSLSN